MKDKSHRYSERVEHYSDLVSLLDLSCLDSTFVTAALNSDQIVNSGNKQYSQFLSKVCVGGGGVSTQKQLKSEVARKRSLDCFVDDSGPYPLTV